MPTNVQGAIIVRALALAAWAFLVEACVTSPYNGQHVPDPSAPVTIAGYSNEPNVPLAIEVSNPVTGAWEVLGTTTSESTPTLTAGLWQNSPPLYFYTTTVQVSDPAHPQTLQRWGDATTRVTNTATLRVRSGDIHLLAGGKGSTDCVSQHASQTEDFYTTVHNCGFQYTTVQIHSCAGGAPDEEPRSELDVIEVPVQWNRIYLPGFTQIDTTTELNGSIAFFGLTTSGGIYYRSPGGDQDLGGSGLKDFSVARNQDGRLEVFAIGSDERIYFNYQTSPNSPSFGGWRLYGGSEIKDVAAGRHPDGRLGLYALGSDGYVYRRQQSSPGAGWGEWQHLPGAQLTRIALATQASGKLMLLGLDPGGGMWSAGLSPTDGLGTYKSIGGWQIQAFEATAEQDGSIHLFAVGGDGYVYEQRQVSPYGQRGQPADFGGWFGLGIGGIRSTAAVLKHDGRLQLLEIGANGQVFDKVQQSAGGTFSAPAHLNGPVSAQAALERGPDGSLEVYVITASGELYVAWQSDACGSWHTLPSEPIINTFAATPNPVRNDKPTTLSWSVSQQCGNGYYEKLHTTDPTGAVSEVFTHLGPATRTLTLPKLGVYRFDLIAGCSQALGGPAERQAVQPLFVTVVPPPKPTVTLSVSPSTVLAGQPVVATWSIATPAGCVLRSRLLVYEGSKQDANGNWGGGQNTAELAAIPASGSYTHVPQENTTLFVVESYCEDGGYDLKNVPVTVKKKKIGTGTFQLNLHGVAPPNPGDPPKPAWYGGNIGTGIPGGQLISLKNTSGLLLYVVKWGYSSDDCNTNPAATFTMLRGAELTDLSDLTGSSATVPLPFGFVTCFYADHPAPKYIWIQATYSYIQ